MSKKANSDEAIAWAREQLDRAISETIERGGFIDEVPTTGDAAVVVLKYGSLEITVIKSGIVAFLE